jgi:hypothetical protein
MEETTVDLRLLLYVEGECLRGQLQDGDHDPRTFSGWLGFVSALDALIAEATEHTNGSQPRRPQ